MEKLLEILERVKPGVDFKNEVGLVENGIIDSFDVVTLISLISQEFDVEFEVSEVSPENFNSAKSLYDTILRLKGE